MSIAWVMVAMGVSVCTGWGLLRALWPRDSAYAVGKSGLLRIPLAIGLGWAVGAAHYCVWRVVYPEFGWLYRLMDCLVIPAAAWWAGRMAQSGSWVPPRAHSPLQPHSPIHRGYVGALVGLTLGVGIAAVCISAAEAWREPLGAWDGWAIWNLKARFLYRGGPHWTAMFSKDIWFSHPDYPLLLPASIARLWSYLGHENTLVPQLTAVAATGLVALLLFGVLAWLRGVEQACFGTLLLVSSKVFLYYGGAQVADVPLSFFLLGAIIALVAAQRSQQGVRALFALSGVLAGCGAMVKNEGLVICVVLLAACMVRRGLRRNALMLVMGMAPALSLMAVQKTLFAGESYLVADQSSFQAVVQKLVDPSRHQTIAWALLDHNVGFYPWRPLAACPLAIPLPNHPGMVLLLLLTFVCGIWEVGRDRLAVAAAAVTLLLTVGTYYVVLLIMPYDLATLVESWPRLQLHIWPSLILVLFLMTRGLGESEQADPASRSLAR